MKLNLYPLFLIILGTLLSFALLFSCGTKKKTLERNKTKTQAEISQNNSQQNDISQTQKDTLSSKEVIEFNELSLNENSTLDLTQADPKKTIKVKTPKGNFEITGANATIKNETETKETNQTTATNIDRSNEFNLLDNSFENTRTEIDFSQKDKRRTKDKETQSFNWIWILFFIALAIVVYRLWKRFSVSGKITNIVKRYIPFI